MIDAAETRRSEPDIVADLPRRLLDEGLGCLSAREKAYLLVIGAIIGDVRIGGSSL